MFYGRSHTTRPYDSLFEQSTQYLPIFAFPGYANASIGARAYSRYAYFISLCTAASEVRQERTKQVSSVSAITNNTETSKKKQNHNICCNDSYFLIRGVPC